MTLSELIERLEKATEPDDKLDTNINAAVLRTVERFEPFPAYTSSIDAALTLVPEGYGWHLWSPDNWLPAAEVRNGERVYYGLTAQAGLPAIALCIAALKAREAMETVG
jgi:hypothetical protein